MTIDIICPLYNAQSFIENLQKSIENQENYNDVKNIRYIITKGKDKTEQMIEQLKTKNEKIIYKIIDSKDFSHSLTREKEAFESNADIIVFITQDVIVKKDNWLKELVKPIEENIVDATYSRQICNIKKSIEYYTRKKNYPGESFIRTKNDIDKLGIKAFFYSDAASAIKRDTFIKLNGYDNLNLPTNEDMYIAYKLLKNDYKIKYCAKSEVIHSHNFSIKETYRRYKTYGEFLKIVHEINLKSNKAGGGLAKYILTSALKDCNLVVIFKFLPNMIARYMGMKVGRK